MSGKRSRKRPRAAPLGHIVTAPTTIGEAPHVAPAIAAPSENGRATKAEMLARRAYVAGLMERGMRPGKAAEDLAEHCSISIEQAGRYVSEVRSEWATAEVAARPTHRAHYLAVLDQVAERAIQAGEYGAAVNAIDKAARITGIYEPDKVQVEHSNADALTEIEKLDEEGRAQLRSVLAKLKRRTDGVQSLH